MPDYKSPRHGVSLSEALHEAANVAPISRVMLNTFELYHPLGTPAGPVYVVNNYVALLATKEVDADRDAGLEVEFMASSIAIERPEESDTAAAPQITLTVTNVSGFMSDALRLARGSLEPWVIIERVYAEDDTTAPAILPPMQLLVISVGIDAENVSLRCSFGDPANVAVPRTTFKRSEYPGLVR